MTVFVSLFLSVGVWSAVAGVTGAPADVASADEAATSSQSASQWLADYGDALKETRAAHKPLLIVIGGESDEDQAAIESVSLSPSGQKDLLPKYTLCRIDVSKGYGKRVAQLFRVASFPTTVIIDTQGKTILFAKAGRMDGDEWQAALARHQSGKRPALRVRRQAVVCST